MVRRKQAGKFEMRCGVADPHRCAHSARDHEDRHAITKLFERDAIAVEVRRFAMRKLTLLWLGDSSVVDADTL